VWKRIAVYGVLLAAGSAALAALDYLELARAHAGSVYTGIVALGFLALGVWVGARALRPPPALPFDGNPAARAALGLSPRELDVLEQLAAGHSNKEIARRLEVSPNTVKTHLAQLYAKLGARRRTDAVQRARGLGLLP
jgi:DNA-binding CsgD family transcriptional regulator